MNYLAIVRPFKKEMDLFKYIKGNLKGSLIVLASIIVGQACLVLWGVNVANLVSSLASRDVGASKHILITLVIIVAVWSLQIYLHSHLFADAMQTMNRRMREDIITNLISSDIKGYSQYDTGTIVSWLTNDITTINTYGFIDLEMVIRQIVGIVFSFAAIIYFHYSITIVVILLAMIMLFLPRIFSKGLNRQMKQVSETTDYTTNIFTDTLHGYVDLVLMNKFDFMKGRVNKASLLLKEEKVKYATKAGMLSGVTNGQSLLSQVILLSFTSWLFFGGVVPIGALSGVQYLAATIFSSLTGLSANLIEIGTVQPIFDKFKSIRMNSSIGSIEAEPFHEIHITDLTFSYPEQADTVLEHINLTFEKGKKYAIIADSGTGKTTLLNIISGMINGYSGEIRWNNDAYDTVNIMSLRKQIMYINQAPHIFNGTILDNITLGESVASDFLDKIIDDVGLRSLIDSLEYGLDTVIEYNSKNISGGQRQRIALARGLALERKLFILDETTSSLDVSSAKNIESILLKKSDVTVIMVNHNISEETQQLIDEIYYL